MSSRKLARPASALAAFALLAAPASAKSPVAHASAAPYRCLTFSRGYQSLPLSFGLSGPVCFNGVNVYAAKPPTAACTHAWWAPNISCSPYNGGSGAVFDRKVGALTLWANWFAVEGIPYPGLPTGAGVPFYPYVRIWVRPNGSWSSTAVL